MVSKLEPGGFFDDLAALMVIRASEIYGRLAHSIMKKKPDHF